VNEQVVVVRPDSVRLVTFRRRDPTSVGTLGLAGLRARKLRMRIVVFGANGGTGRLLTQQTLDAGHDVVAVTRSPSQFPIAHENLTVAWADALDRKSAAKAVEGADAVLSTLGVPFSRQPIYVYSEGVKSLTWAMERQGVKRIVVVSSAGTEPTYHADGGFLMNRVMQPIVIRTIGKTTYHDMRAMEAWLDASNLDWTVMRPSGLFDAEDVSNYELREGSADGIFTSRADLAACLLEEATDRQFVHRAVAVTTSEGVPTLFQLLRREALKKA
jgi:putative NADH-flavin reductase